MYTYQDPYVYVYTALVCACAACIRSYKRSKEVRRSLFFGFWISGFFFVATVPIFYEELLWGPCLPFTVSRKSSTYRTRGQGQICILMAAIGI